MSNVINYINDWKGILLVVVVALFYVIFNWKESKGYAKAWILEAERLARKQLISAEGERKKQWVINRYDMLPTRVKYVLVLVAPIFRRDNGQDLWAWIIQRVFDWLKKKMYN